MSDHDPVADSAGPATGLSSAPSSDGGSLDILRERVTTVASLPVDERPAVFAEVNAAIVSELNAMADDSNADTGAPDRGGPAEA